MLAPANAQTPEGQPDFRRATSRSSNTTTSPLDQPGIYFGEDLDGYFVVDHQRPEIDYQDASGKNVTSRYNGEGGVAMSSFVRRAAFALRFGELQPAHLGNFTPTSKIIIIRDVQERVAALAPFLHWDADPYPVILDGRIQYVIDGYTTTDVPVRPARHDRRRRRQLAGQPSTTSATR